jgi:hypothetical protein|tara:strand:- start:87 stop:287 length:201 start_codon:yes stop_codon:yes gene_type:complete
MNYHKITNQELFLDFKETYLNLQRALLKANLIEQVNETSETYEQIKKSLLQEVENEEQIDDIKRQL